MIQTDIFGSQKEIHFLPVIPDSGKVLSSMIWISQAIMFIGMSVHQRQLHGVN